MLGSVLVGLVLISECSAATNTVTFQNGVGGYIGTEDKKIDSRGDGYTDAPDKTTLGTSTWDSGTKRYILLLKFKDVFGFETNQILPHVNIESAKLTLKVTSLGNANCMHKMLVDWNESNAVWSYSGFDGGGVGLQTNDIDATSQIYADSRSYTNSSGVVPTGTEMVFDITTMVQEWSDGDSNYGMELEAITDDSGDTLWMASSENGTTNDRPELSITYIEAESITFQEGAGGYAGTHDTWFGARSFEYGPYGSQTTMKTARWSSSRQQGLIKFEDVFGEATNQVSFRDTIKYAELIVNIPDESAADGDPNYLYKMLIDWDESTAAYDWAGFGGDGVETNDIEATALSYANSLSYTNSSGTISKNTEISFGVTSIAQDWSDGDGNYGVMLDGFTTASGNGLLMASSEHATISLRPKLRMIIERVPPQGTVIIVK